MNFWTRISGLLTALGVVLAVIFSGIFLIVYWGLDFWSSGLPITLEGFQAYWESTHPIASPFKGVLINFLSASLAFLCVKIVYDFVQRRRAMEEQENFFARVGDLFEERVEGLLSVSAIHYFEESYYDIAWREILKGATSVRIVAAYWSREWLRDNLRELSDLARSTKIQIYLTHPASALDAYGAPVLRDWQTRTKVLDCALQFADADGNIEVHILDKAPSYMYCVVSDGRSRKFIFSPYQMGDQTRHGRAPVVGLNLGVAGEKVVSFVDGEIAALEQATDLASLELQKHLHWSEDGDRVVVSLRLGCTLGCQFCYVPSLQATEVATGYRDDSLFGFALAQKLVSDIRFSSGRTGTKILVGGMTDPFLPPNSKGLSAFLEQIASVAKDNPLHIATRLSPKSPIVDALARLKNAAVSTSVAHLGEDLASDPPSKTLERRLFELNVLKSRGVDVSIYLRPLIPNATERDLPRIMEVAQSSGIDKFVLGNLYVDKEILKLSRMDSKIGNKDNTIEKKMLVDPEGKLRKVNQEVLRSSLRLLLEEQNFQVFDSSGDYIDALGGGEASSH